MREVIDIENLAEWRKQNPDVKHVTVKHGDFGYAEYTFNYKKPEDVTISESLGQYDAWGNLHFVDSEGTFHKCLSTRRYNFKPMIWNR